MHHPVITTTCAFICLTGSNEGAPSLKASAGGSPSGLDVASLERLTVRYFHKGLAKSTCCSYNSAQNRYCRDAMLRPLQVSESILCYFVVHLADGSLKHCTIMAYLSAVRFLHIAEGFSDPFEPHLNRLQYTLRGMKLKMVVKMESPLDPIH